MNDIGYEKLYEIILDIVEPKLAQAGIDRNAIKPDTDIMDILDSFAILDTIIEIEERAGVSVDLAQMDITNTMTVSGLAKEIVRINSHE